MLKIWNKKYEQQQQQRAAGVAPKAKAPPPPQQRLAKWKMIRDRDIASPAAIEVWNTTELAVKILENLPSATILKLSVLDKRTKNIIHRTPEVLHDFIFKDIKRSRGDWQEKNNAQYLSFPSMMRDRDFDLTNIYVCREHGCQGRMFFSLSTYRKHCRECSVLNPLLPGHYSENGHTPCNTSPDEEVEEAWYVEAKRLSNLGWESIPGQLQRLQEIHAEARQQRLREANDEREAMLQRHQRGIHDETSPLRRLHVLPVWYVSWVDLQMIARTENGSCWQEVWITKDKELVEVRAEFPRRGFSCVHARTVREVIHYMRLPHDAILDSAVLKWRLETLGAPVEAIEVLGLKDVVPRDRPTPSEDGEAPTARRIMPAQHVEE